MLTDDALAVPYTNRLAPHRCLPVKLVPAKGARGASIASEAESSFGQEGVGIRPETVSDIVSALVQHGIAIGYNVATPRSDGTRINVEMRAWPMEYVRWDPYARVLKTRVDPSSVPENEVDPAAVAAGVYGYTGGWELPIIHGDGRWVVFQKRDIDPFRHDSALASALPLWAVHGYAMKDWGKGSLTHGSAKIVGKMPSGVPLQDKDGLTKEAQAFLELLEHLATSDNPTGIAPAGSEVAFVQNASTAWQVWTQLVATAEKKAARIYLGTDGMLGAQGGAPGVDITQLFGVATTLVQGDLACLERSILTGVIEPWCAMNFGDSTLAPRRVYMMPDPDEEARRTSLATRRTAFFSDIQLTRDNGFEITQDYVNATAAAYEVAPPTLPKQDAKAPSITLAPTDVARVVTVNEARASAGLPALTLEGGAPDPDGKLTLEQFSAKKTAELAPPPAPPASGMRDVG